MAPLSRAGLVVLLCAAGSYAGAADYPNKPIRLIVPSAAAGPLDLVARTVSPGMSELLGQQVVVDNRSGAGGLIGTETVAKSSPDGYTLLLGTSGVLLIVPKIHTSPPYSPGDFAPVSVAASMPMLLLVAPSLPAKSVQDLVALAKAKPGELNYASGGVGTGIHVYFELFNIVAGVKITHVPYKGAGPAMTAVLGNEAQAMFNGLGPALPMVKGGKLRAIATGGRSRSPLLPNLPTVAESGLNYEYTAWYSIVAPKGTPQPIVNALHKSIAATLAKPEYRDRLTSQGVDVIGSSPAEFAKFLKLEDARIDRVVKAAGLKGKGGGT